MRSLVFLSFALAACCNQPHPSPVPTPPPPPPDPTVVTVVDGGAPSPEPVRPRPPSGTCEAMCLNLEVLRCPEWSPTCPSDCSRLDARLTALGSKPTDHACVEAAKSCDESRKCGAR